MTYLFSGRHGLVFESKKSSAVKMRRKNNNAERIAWDLSSCFVINNGARLHGALHSTWKRNSRERRIL